MGLTVANFLEKKRARRDVLKILEPPENEKKTQNLFEAFIFPWESTCVEKRHPELDNAKQIKRQEVTVMNGRVYRR